jgi:hypothetical protein
MARFDGGTGEIDFNKFAVLVMDSSKDDRYDSLQDEQHLGHWTGEAINRLLIPVSSMVLSHRTGWTSPTKGGKNLGFDHFMMNEKTFMVNIKRQLKKQWKQVKTSFGHAGEFMTYDQVRDMFYLMNLDMSDGQFKELISEIGAQDVALCCPATLDPPASHATVAFVKLTSARNRLMWMPFWDLPCHCTHLHCSTMMVRWSSR